MVDAIVSALLQVAVALAIALAVYLIARRPAPSFRHFIGLTAAPVRAVLIGIALGAVVAAAVLLLPGMGELASREGATGHAAGTAGGTVGMLVVAVFGALIKTSLSEEIFFRGLIGRNLIRRYGFATGNGIQAMLFGAVHALIAFVPGVSAGLVLFAVLFSGTFGWINGWLNERLAGGSILPGWAAHGTANLTTYLIVALTLSEGG